MLNLLSFNQSQKLKKFKLIDIQFFPHFHIEMSDLYYQLEEINQTSEPGAINLRKRKAKVDLM